MEFFIPAGGPSSIVFKLPITVMQFFGEEHGTGDVEPRVECGRAGDGSAARRIDGHFERLTAGGGAGREGAGAKGVDAAGGVYPAALRQRGMPVGTDGVSRPGGTPRSPRAADGEDPAGAGAMPTSAGLARCRRAAEVRGWVTEHIEQLDQNYGEWLNERGIV